MPPPDHNPEADPSSRDEPAAPDPLLRARRLEEIGLLTTRMGHDLNNMLTPLLIAMPMLRSELTEPAALSLLDSLEATVGRATGLVRQVVEYAHGVGVQFQMVMMRQLLEEVTAFARATFPRNIRVELKIPADLWLVKANLSQLHQVLLNLCVNARDAMPQGGILSLSAENCRLDAAAAALIDGGQAGTFLVLRVADTGTGFSPPVWARRWQPGNTTKQGAEGAGLGLLIIRDLVISHRGFIDLTTAVGRGSSFRIYLPADPTVVAAPGVSPSGEPHRLVDSSSGVQGPE